MINFYQKIIKIFFSVLFFIGLFFASSAFATTEFESIIDPDNASGTDYTSLSSWEAAVQTDLTASTTLVFSHAGIIGSIADTDTVTGATSGATADVVHTTTDQILLENISGIFQSGEQVYEAQDTNYVIISNNGDSTIALATCRSTGGTADTTAVAISGWTTDEDNYIKVWTDPDDEYGRHDGVWDDGKYRLEVSANSIGGTISTGSNYIYIDGLQIKQSNESVNHYNMRGISLLDSSVSYISNNIVTTGTVDAATVVVRGLSSSAAASNFTSSIWNNIFYDFNVGSYARAMYIYASTGYDQTVHVYNNTFIDNTVGLYRDSGGATVIAKNNVAQNNMINFTGSFHADSTNNISDDATYASVTNDFVNTTVSFLDSDNDDFHIASGSNARDVGVDLSSDSNLAFSTDIDGEDRGITWDVGADEVTKVTQANKSSDNFMTDGLVGHWTFDGQDMDWSQSSAEVRDISGQDNHGDAVNSPVSAIGKQGQALEFDGVDDYVDLGNDSLLKPDEITISVWVNKNNSDTTTTAVLGKVAASNIDYRLRYLNSKHFDWSYNDTNILTGDGIFPINRWYHVLFTGGTNGVAGYVNGVLDGSDTIPWTKPDNSEDLLIGDALYATNFPGLIDDVRIYNRALPEEEVEKLYDYGARKLQLASQTSNSLTDGLVGHWTFDGPDMDWSNSTAEVRDISGNGNHGDAQNNQEPAIGRQGQALVFDGVDDYISIPNSTSINIQTNITMSTWINNKTWKEADVLEKGGSGGYIIWSAPSLTNRVVCGRQASSAGQVYSITTFNDKLNQWMHIACTYDGVTLKIYYNGVLDNSKASNTSFSNLDGLKIGTGLDSYLDGLIDEVRIYNRDLSEEEVEKLFRIGSRKYQISQ